MWEAIYDDDCEAWLLGLDEKVRVAILACVELLRARGPQLGRPYVDSVEGSRFSNMKELRNYLRT